MTTVDAPAPENTDEKTETGRVGRGRPSNTIDRDQLVLGVLQTAQLDADGERVGISRTKLAEAVNAAHPDAGITDSLTYLALIRLRGAGEAEQFRNYGESRWKTPGDHKVLARPKPTRKAAAPAPEAAVADVTAPNGAEGDGA